ncbi:MAG: thioredoxin [Candidatus Babeliales bacterium]
MPIAITKENYETEIINTDKPIIIDVFAPWCGPCQQMMPIFEELEKEYGDKYKFVKLNVDESRELAVQYGVTSIPTFVFLKNGEVQGKETGYIAKEDLLEKIKDLLG